MALRQAVEMFLQQSELVLYHETVEWLDHGCQSSDRQWHAAEVQWPALWNRHTPAAWWLGVPENRRHQCLCQLVGHSHCPCRHLMTSVHDLYTIHTHTHNRFTALLDFVQDYPGEHRFIQSILSLRLQYNIVEVLVPSHTQTDGLCVTNVSKTKN